MNRMETSFFSRIINNKIMSHTAATPPKIRKANRKETERFDSSAIAPLNLAQTHLGQPETPPRQGKTKRKASSTLTKKEKKQKQAGKQKTTKPSKKKRAAVAPVKAKREAKKTKRETKKTKRTLKKRAVDTEDGGTEKKVKKVVTSDTFSPPRKPSIFPPSKIISQYNIVNNWYDRSAYTMRKDDSTFQEIDLLVIYASILKKTDVRMWTKTANVLTKLIDDIRRLDHRIQIAYSRGNSSQQQQLHRIANDVDLLKTFEHDLRQHIRSCCEALKEKDYTQGIVKINSCVDDLQTSSLCGKIHQKISALKIENVTSK